MPDFLGMTANVFLIANRSTTTTMKNPFLTAVLISLSFSTAVSAATVIYQDDFSGLATSNLNGTTPDVGANNWVASTDIKANGSALTSNERAAYLPFAPVAGFIYTATIGVDFVSSGSGTGSLQFAFANTSSISVHPAGNSGGSGQLFIRQNGSGVSRSNHGTDILAQANGTYNLATPPIDVFTMTLNTTGSAWTYQGAINGTNVGNLFTYTTNPTITQIAFGGNGTGGGTGTFSNFSLTSVPEPSTGLLALLGGLFLLRRKR